VTVRGINLWRRLQAKTVATAAAAVAGFNEIDLAFERYKAAADGKQLAFSGYTHTF